jgi:hypothetical protein
MTGRELLQAVALSSEGHAYIRIRDSRWANPHAYARLRVVQMGHGPRALGPWVHLFDRPTQEAIGEPTPQAVLITATSLPAFFAEEVIEYTGPLDPKDV